MFSQRTRFAWRWQASPPRLWTPTSGQLQTGKMAPQRSTVFLSDTIFLGPKKRVRRSMGQSEGNFFNGAEILIAEDSPTQAEQLTHYLSARGYTVTVARDGKQALAAALRSKPAMIITDVMMPEMDGYTLCKEIKSLPAIKDVPVVLLTSLSRPQ